MRFITRDRLDLTQWITHFVHDRNPSNDPSWIFYEGDPEMQLPSNFPDDERINGFWCMESNNSTLEPDADAFSVVKRIVYEGHIKSGWSFRGGKATIYGHQSAVCFTEMPLSALIDYASKRDAGDLVKAYGFAFLRDELFAAGARPVIYGLSSDHREVGDDRWPRVLGEDCGIGMREQYRYVATSLGKGRPIDWTHEREWRWADLDHVHECPGLPLWLESEERYFSRIIIIVPTNEEQTRLLSWLKNRRESGGTEYDFRYDVEAIDDVRVVSLEGISQLLAANPNLRVEDIPVGQVLPVVMPVVTPAVQAAVVAALSNARAAAAAAAAAWRELDDGRSGVFGFSDVALSGNINELLQAFVIYGQASPTAFGGYLLDSATAGATRTGLVGEAEAAAKAACDILSDEFDDLSFTTYSRLD